VSKRFLKKLLEETIAELEKPSNTRQGIDGFRQTDSDLKEHTFKSSVNGVKAQVIRELTSPTYRIDIRVLIDQRFEETLDKYVRNLVNGTYEKARKKYGSNVNTRVVGNRSAWAIKVLEAEKNERVYWKDTPESVFNAIKNLFSSRKDTLVKNLNTVLKSIDPDAFKNSQSSEIQAGKFLDLGHRAGSSVVEQQVGRASSQLSSRINTYNQRAKQDNKITEKDIRNLGLGFFVKKKATKEKETLEVGFESEYYNRLYGTTTEASFKRDALQRLRNALLKVDKSKSLSKRPGSDTRIDVERKKVIERFDTKIVRRKNVKVKSDNFKIDLTKTAKETKKANKKVKKVKPKNLQLGALKGLKAPGPKKSSAASNISMIALINQKLPRTVKNNMGAPGLENKTGRFAESVRVTDISQTARGFPSIGYTYRKNPYQIFEKGAGKPPWATVDRDPRKLIDKSIREIAAELLTARFYTRRV
jgi:hypothetical protein